MNTQAHVHNVTLTHVCVDSHIQHPEYHSDAVLAGKAKWPNKLSDYLTQVGRFGSVVGSHGPTADQ